AHELTARGGDASVSRPWSTPRELVAAGGDGACTVDEDLSTALGVAQARDLLRRANWIVAVVDARSALSAACEQRIRQLGRKRRLLIIWCEVDGAPGPSRSEPLLEEMLARCGLAHLGPVSGLTGDELIEVLEALKVMEQACLLRLRVRESDSATKSFTFAAAARPLRGETSASAARPSPSEPAPAETTQPAETVFHLEQDGGNHTPADRTYGAGRSAASIGSDAADPTTPEARPSGLAPIEAALVKVVAGEPGVVVLDLRVDAVSERLGSRLRDRYFVVDRDDPHVWQWCAGLVAGGCRPILLTSEAGWFDTATALAALPDGIELRATAVVLARSERASKRSTERTGFLREAVLASASDLVDLERLLSFSLSHDGLMLIWAPPQPRGQKADRELRVDQAESAWLKRLRRGGPSEYRQIVGKRFSDELAPWIAAYESVGQRGGYIWKWCLHGVELTTLSCVPASLRGDACDTKVLAGMFNVLIDDVADQQGNDDLLAAFRRLVHGGDPGFDQFPPSERRYGEFTRDVWSEIWRRAKRYPCYDPYASLLQFDLVQLFNTVHYSHLVNSNPYILNVVEHDDYSPQGMGLLSFAMIDLMCSPTFVANELGKLREAMWHAQWMARIGNLITTWQREVRDRDYSSGVFATAIARRDLTIDQLLTGDPAQIAAAIERGGHESHFLRRWKQHRGRLRRLLCDVGSVDLGAMMRGLERLLQTELVSRGEK
ncbi:MAG TPA: hypothetical protein VHC22_13100, partial [Pirellulales bacterium]|nr:hypothetical protein [Pirellulales bacterium]